ncbi:pyridoxal-phosphate-dependent aminotransferase family protein [Albirhodobacter sp. R86504]|uniref:pyridoxal-phosphate-dependent aminotransferase family protein n=1 Tax=Albirhodobacter sp. R86504 TaxID=3093848 RepID=UPI00366CA15F
MSLANGRPYLAIPGPSTMPDRVLGAMHRGAPNIYEGKLIEETAQIVADLKRVALCSSNVAIYIGNGHAAWEAVNTNLFSRGDKVLVLATGRFGMNWARGLSELGVDVEILDFGLQSPADPDRVSERLRADRGHTIKAVLICQTDTASSIRSDVAALRGAIDAAAHPALFGVDCIASLGCDMFRFDDWGVDVMVSGSQKGLMTPPGLGFVWFNDKALAASKTADLRTPYWNWEPRATPEQYWQHFNGTAPTHHLFGLGEALRMILDEEGLEAVWARHTALAGATHAAFAHWGQGHDIALNVADPRARSHSVTAARIGNGGAGRLRKWCEDQAGVTLGIGLGMAEPDAPNYGDFLRVAHMGHVNAHMTLGVLAVMEAGMIALDIPHTAGGATAAARVVAAATRNHGL